MELGRLANDWVKQAALQGHHKNAEENDLLDEVVRLEWNPLTASVVERLVEVVVAIMLVSRSNFLELELSGKSCSDGSERVC